MSTSAADFLGQHDAGEPPDRWQAVRDGYVTALRRAANPIADNDLLREQTLRQAHRVVAGILRLPPLDEDGSDDLSESIGFARALGGLHPSHSLGAAHLLFETVMPVLIEAGASAQQIVALHRAMAEKLTVASYSYVDTLLLELSNAQAAERRRISRSLHDEAAHSIGHALLLLDDTGIPDGEPVRRARAAVHEALEDVRRLTGELRRSGEIDDFASALHQWVAENDLDGRVRITLTGNPALVPRTYGEGLYFTIREAIRNALDHAPGSAVDVTVTVATDSVSAQVTDRGPGLRNAEGPRPGHGHGVAGMRERIELLHGTIGIVDAPGGGTRVILDVPLLSPPG